MSSKFGAGQSEALNVLLLTLRGTPCTYYGEELGMGEIALTFAQTRDPWGRNFGPVSALCLLGGGGEGGCGEGGGGGG